MQVDGLLMVSARVLDRHASIILRYFSLNLNNYVDTNIYFVILTSEYVEAKGEVWLLILVIRSGWVRKLVLGRSQVQLSQLAS
jgi:hypothetical protein